MNKRVVFFSFTVLALCACAENSDQATPDGAMNQLRDAVLTNDAAKVLTLSSKKTRQLLQDILHLARKQDDVFRRTYPPEFALGARGAYPPGVLTAKSELALFKALTRARGAALKRGDGLRYGLTASGHPVVLGETATVATKSSESIDFVLEEGVWRTKVFEPVLSRNLERFRLNQATLEENLRTIAKGATPTTDEGHSDSARKP